MTTLQPVSVSRLYRVIAAQLRERIRAGAWKAGERLPSERDLAEMLAVSRPSVREALIALEIEGWVDVRVGSGVYVTAPAPNGLGAHAAPGASNATAQALKALAGTDVAPHGLGAKELLEARLVIEPVCAELAALHASDAQLQRIQTHAQALPEGEEPAQEDENLHLLIGEASGNPALAALLRHLWKLGAGSAILSKLNEHFVHREVWDAAHREHTALVRALVARKPRAARRAMTEHLTGISERLGLGAGEDLAGAAGSARAAW